jgi:DNA polymerase III epsilon subunit-like protein
MLYIIGDTETAGLGKEKKAVEIALRAITPELVTIQQWESLVDPEIPINPAASQIHGIYDHEVALAPTSAEFVDHVIGGKFVEDICLIGHNVQFDYPLLTMIGNITHTVCTLELARAFVKGPANFKLQTLREYFGIPEDSAHRAMGDVNVTHQLLGHLIRVSGRSLEAHAMTLARVIHTMPFGKHAGVALVDLPKQYIIWLLELPDLDTNLRESLKTVRLLKS